mmetsp:Transcript_4870/g.14091  ORF Transcript_4870/g.14091 Transcript_4870/m.14091 type:complete len:247 (-) Transcript_4870:128-868(-)
MVVLLVRVILSGRVPYDDRAPNSVHQPRKVLHRLGQYDRARALVQVLPRDLLHQPVDPKQLQLHFEVIHQPRCRLRNVKEVRSQEHQHERPVLNECRTHHQGQLVRLLPVPLDSADALPNIDHGAGNHFGRFLNDAAASDSVYILVHFLAFLDGQSVQVLDDGALSLRRGRPLPSRIARHGAAARDAAVGEALSMLLLTCAAVIRAVGNVGVLPSCRFGVCVAGCGGCWCWPLHPVLLLGLVIMEW